MERGNFEKVIEWEKREDLSPENQARSGNI